MSSDFSHLQIELLGAFFEEALESLDLLEAGLLHLDAKHDAGTINDIFRAAHSVKGAAGTFGFADVTAIAHEMESLLDGVRSQRRAATASLCALLLEAVDVLKRLLIAQRDHKSLEGLSTEDITRRLRAELAASPVLPTAAAVPASRTATTKAIDLGRQEGAGALLSFRPHPHLLRTGNEPLRLLRELRALGSVTIAADVSRLPPFRELSPLDCHLAWTAQIPAEISRADVEDVFSWVDGDCDLTFSPLADAIEGAGLSAPTDLPPTATPDQAPPPAASPEGGATSAARRSDIGAQLSSVRVSIDKIDFLMNMVGELVITQSMLGEIEDDRPLSPARIARLREGLSQLARHTRTLQEGVMRLRSLPVSTLFHRFPRLVHDLGASLGKKVQLRVEGESTELDKTVLEKLGDPLVHLVRNSLDHGFETPEERIAAHKPEVGTLTLRAWHRGGDIIIEVKDDGRGIHPDKVRARAQSRGIIAESEALTEAAAMELIFAPGFSTAENVTDLSGRGVGMDVVRQNVRSLGGDVSLTSVPGQGTQVTLRLPVTLAIVEGQLVRVGDHIYVVPLLPIIESLPIDSSKVRRLADRGRLYLWRNALVPLTDMGARLLNRAPSTSDEGRQLVIVETDHGPCGLVVDELLGQQQIVVKSLEANFERIPGLAGATILGDGDVALILDVATMAADRSKGNRPEGNRPDDGRREAARGRGPLAAA